MHCVLSTDTATHDVTYQSVMKLLTNEGQPGSLEDLPPIPTNFIYGHTAETTKKETKQIQFKHLSATTQYVPFFILLKFVQVHVVSPNVSGKNDVLSYELPQKGLKSKKLLLIMLFRRKCLYGERQKKYFHVKILIVVCPNRTCKNFENR